MFWVSDGERERESERESWKYKAKLLLIGSYARRREQINIGRFYPTCGNWSGDSIVLLRSGILDAFLIVQRSFPFRPLNPPPPTPTHTIALHNVSSSFFNVTEACARAHIHTRERAHTHARASTYADVHAYTYTLARPLAKWRRKVTKCVAGISYACIILILDFGQ